MQSCGTNCSVVQTSAKERMYFRLRGENPCVPGNARFKSLDRRSMTFAPHFCCAWRPRISRPICQYSRTNSRFHRQASPQLCRSNPVFQGFEELGVIRWKVCKFTHQQYDLNQIDTSRALHVVNATSNVFVDSLSTLHPSKFTRRALCSVLLVRSPPSRLTAGCFRFRFL